MCFFRDGGRWCGEVFSETHARERNRKWGMIECVCVERACEGELIKFVFAQTEDIHVKRECILKYLIIYLGEDEKDLIREYLVRFNIHSFRSAFLVLILNSFTGQIKLSEPCLSYI